MATDDGLRYIDSDGHILEHPTGDARLRAGGVPRPDLAHRDRRGRRGVARTTTAPVTPANGMARGGHRGHERRGPRPGVPAARCATPRCARRRTTPRRASRTWTRTASTSRCSTRRCMLGLQSDPRRRLRRGAGARVQRLVLRPHPGRRGPAVRRRRGAADARRRRRAARRRRDPARRRAAGHGVGVHAPEPVGRLAAVQRPGLRPDLAGRGRTPASRSRSTRSSRPTCPARASGLRLGRPRNARRQLRRRLRPERRSTHEEQLEHRELRAEHAASRRRSPTRST